MNLLYAFFLAVIFGTMVSFTSPAKALGEGEKAPVFTASSTQGEISLADYRGKKNVVLALYFAVNTPV